MNTVKLHPRDVESAARQGTGQENPTCIEEMLNGLVELLGIGWLQLDVQGFQAQIQGGSHHLLHVPSQAVQMHVQHADQLLVLVVSCHLQVVPELVNLRAAA